MSLVMIVIRVLTDDDDLYVMERSIARPVEYLLVNQQKDHQKTVKSYQE